MNQDFWQQARGPPNIQHSAPPPQPTMTPTAQQQTQQQPAQQPTPQQPQQPPTDTGATGQELAVATLPTAPPTANTPNSHHSPGGQQQQQHSAAAAAAAAAAAGLLGVANNDAKMMTEKLVNDLQVSCHRLFLACRCHACIPWPGINSLFPL